MPELPDVVLYVEHVASRIVGHTLIRIEVVSPNLLRTADPPIESVGNRVVRGVERLGKRVVIELEDEWFLVFHLMIAGRFHWKPRGAKAHRKLGLATIEFSSGSLLLTEAGSRKRASLHVIRGRAALRALDPGGLEIFETSLESFRDALTRENHTLKRTLTDPRILSGIGNAYSDEILHRAKLSPLRQSRQLEPPEIERLFDASRDVLREWLERLRREAGDEFPEGVTAFRAGMAVHGRYRQPCPVCDAPIQRIVYADNETNYCARCQTGGRLLADRALSRLLKNDWPRSLDEMDR